MEGAGNVSADHPAPSGQPGPSAGPEPPQLRPEGPAPGRPPGRRRTVALVLGGVAVVAVLAVAGGLLLLRSGDEKGSGTAYRLTTPRTLADAYRRQGSGESRTGGRLFSGGKAGDAGHAPPGTRARGNVTAKYAASGGRQLTFNGLYGELSHPADAVDWLFGQLDSRMARIGAKPQGAPKRVTPSGFDGEVLKCQRYVVKSSANGAPRAMALSVCAWGDASTLGSVSAVHLVGGDSVPLARTDAAELAARVRADARVPAD